MINFIDTFTNRFVKQVCKIEYERRELSNYIGEDRRQGDRFSYLESQLERINEVLKTVEET